MAQSTFEITGQGTDREALAYNGLRYWLDLTSDPHNSIGWAVEDERGGQDMCTVSEAAAVPGAREYVLERTRDAIGRAKQRAAEFDYPQQPIRWLEQELAEATG